MRQHNLQGLVCMCVQKYSYLHLLVAPANDVSAYNVFVAEVTSELTLASKTEFLGYLDTAKTKNTIVFIKFLIRGRMPDSNFSVPCGRGG